MVLEVDVVAEPLDQIAELRHVSLARISWTILYETGTSEPGSSGSGASAIRMSDSRSRQAIDDLASRLPPGELAEVLLDVLDLEGSALERILLDQVLHQHSTGEL